MRPQSPRPFSYSYLLPGLSAREAGSCRKTHNPRSKEPEPRAQKARGFSFYGPGFLKTPHADVRALRRIRSKGIAVREKQRHQARPGPSPARAMLRATGLDDAAIARPLVAVVHTWSDVSPCNITLRDLAQHVRRGVHDGGGTPIEFNTIAVTDGIAMGTDGMRASLASRETIADSIELAVSGHCLDAMVLLVGCDKTIPAAAMAAARLDIPTVILYGGTIMPGHCPSKKGQSDDKPLTVQDVFEAVGAHSAGRIDDSELHRIESHACPGAGACGGQFTANTMAMVLTFLGLSPLGYNDIPAIHEDKPEAARLCGELVMQQLRNGGPTPRALLSVDALRNAARAVSATAGSTNAALHLLAIAHEAGVAFDLEEFEAAAHTPVIADLKPGGRYTAAEMFEFGGAALVARELKTAGLIEDIPTVTGRSFSRNCPKR
ncbi:dihydroxy-acid dehydratase domain-containing protein [Lysobacter gummosus]|uniref:dihydroxy-acid dehydratase domain-containing protein n=1 Tax=Lysobacter gummosus TaxID=262324 RepID=UPI00362B7C0E